MLGNALHFRRDIVVFVENAVNGFHDGDVGLIFLVDFVDRAAGRIAFRHHAQLHQRHAHGKTVADHDAEEPVAAVSGVGSHQQVAQIDGINKKYLAEIPIVETIYGILYENNNVSSEMKRIAEHFI